MSYPEEFKKMIVQKALTPGSPGVMKVAEKNGVHYDTLRRWLKSYGHPIYMDDTKARPENWSKDTYSYQF